MIKVAKAGFWGGDFEKIRNAYYEDVMNVFSYECFLEDYEKEFYELNNN